MSRIGSYPVVLKNGVELSIVDDIVTFKGPLGSLEVKIPTNVTVSHHDNKLLVAPVDSSKVSRMNWGTARSLLNNAANGVVDGFKTVLELVGVGYRALLKDNQLTLQVGYSHDIIYDIPQGIKISCPDQVTIEVFGVSKELVGKTVADIKSYRKVEPYKGKGIKKAGEFVLRKEGKKK